MLDGHQHCSGAQGNFTNVGKKAIPIRAIRTVQIFKCVEIGHVITVKHKEVTAFYFLNFVNRKADCLIDADKKIQHHKGNNQRLDEWRCENDQQRRARDIADQCDFYLTMAQRHVVFKPRPALLDTTLEIIAPPRKLKLIFAFKRIDFLDKICDTAAHHA